MNILTYPRIIVLSLFALTSIILGNRQEVFRVKSHETLPIPLRKPQFLSVTVVLILSAVYLTGCAAANVTDSEPGSLTPTAIQAENSAAKSCPVTEPEWLKPPEDSAVQGSSEPGYYFANADQSILASAWWAEQEAYQLYASEDGIKVGWFRPEGAELEITGQRLDAQAPRLEAHVPCCYPTRFQATGLLFSTEGCWEVVAKAADSELSFIVWVEP